MKKNTYPNYSPKNGYLTEKTRQQYISNAVKNKVLPKGIRCLRWKCYRTFVVSFSVSQVPKPFQGLIDLGQQLHWVEPLVLLRQGCLLLQG